MSIIDLSKIDYTEVGNAIYKIMVNSTKEFWKEQLANNEVFLRDLAYSIAKEKVLMHLASNENEIAEHQRNLIHLAATLQGEIVRAGFQVKRFKRDLFIKILQSIIITVAIPLLKAEIKERISAP